MARWSNKFCALRATNRTQFIRGARSRCRTAYKQGESHKVGAFVTPLFFPSRDSAFSLSREAVVAEITIESTISSRCSPLLFLSDALCFVRLAAASYSAVASIRARAFLPTLVFVNLGNEAWRNAERYLTNCNAGDRRLVLISSCIHGKFIRLTHAAILHRYIHFPLPLSFSFRGIYLTSRVIIFMIRCWMIDAKEIAIKGICTHIRGTREAISYYA